MTDVVAVSFTAGKAWRARYGELATTVTGPAPRNKHSRDTTIALDHLWLSAETLDLDRDQSIEVSVDITNTGSRPGKEVIQLYVADLESTAQKPPKELKGFAKVEVMPGETKTATFTIDRRALQHYDPQQERWCVEPGAFEVLVGNSSADIRLRGRFRASGFNPYGYGPDTPVARVMNDERAVAVLREYLPVEAVAPQAIAMALTYFPHRPLKTILSGMLAHTLPGAPEAHKRGIEAQIYQALAQIEI